MLILSARVGEKIVFIDQRTQERVAVIRPAVSLHRSNNRGRFAFEIPPHILVIREKENKRTES